MANDASELVARVVARDTRAIARAVRLVDDRDQRGRELLKTLYPHTGRAYVLGVTGSPGSGKSTLVDRLIEGYRKRGSRVGVIAVDPSSPYSGGALLGDRIRMQRHFLDSDVFIRSLATRGHLGGLSRSAGDVIRVLDAAGFDVLIVETVGVGQDELEVARLAHTTVVVMAPGLGDDVQANKAGILEIADVFAVNKADRDGADAAVHDLEQFRSLTFETRGAEARFHTHSTWAADASSAHENAPDDTWMAPIVRTVAMRNEGVEELLGACDRHRAHLSRGEGARTREKRQSDEFQTIFRETLFENVERRLAGHLANVSQRIVSGAEDPYSAAEALVHSVLRDEGTS